MMPPLSTADGRRAWAFLAIVGGCVSMTLLAALGVYIVSSNVALSFWLAIAAHVQILVGMTGLGALFIKRTIRVNRDGVEIEDHKDTPE